MKNSCFILFLILGNFALFAQQITCSPQDKKALETKIVAIKGLFDADLGKTLVAVGKTFIDTPYVAKTLEVGDTESLVINLHGLDCTTFVENVLTLGQMLKDGTSDFDEFTKTLQTVRYKDGLLNGYASRLHYFSEWMANNEKKGLIKNITAEIGGIEITKDINFMSTHRDLYPFLKDNDNFQKIQASEKYLNNQALCILPQELIAANEQKIHSGDIIALTTSIDGLDITHTGIATLENDGRIHLLHASTGSMKVEVSKLPLAEYLKGIKKNTGIMVARPL